MKGKLKKEETTWTIVYKDIIRLFPYSQYGMKEIELHPRSRSTVTLEEGQEVEFDIITVDNGDNGIRYAVLQ